nr:amphi-Trp domain-containing protein [Nocardia carnea]
MDFVEVGSRRVEVARQNEFSRKEVSERLSAIGHSLAGGSEVELGSEGDTIEIVVADRAARELEIEVDGDKTEIVVRTSDRRVGRRRTHGSMVADRLPSRPFGEKWHEIVDTGISETLVNFTPLSARSPRAVHRDAE